MEEQVPVYRIEVLLLTNDAPVAVPFLAQLEAKGFIEGVNPVFTRWKQLEYRKDQTSIFVETLKNSAGGPARRPRNHFPLRHNQTVRLEE